MNALRFGQIYTFDAYDGKATEHASAYAEQKKSSGVEAEVVQPLVKGDFGDNYSKAYVYTNENNPALDYYRESKGGINYLMQAQEQLSAEFPEHDALVEREKQAIAAGERYKRTPEDHDLNRRWLERLNDLLYGENSIGLKVMTALEQWSNEAERFFFDRNGKQVAPEDLDKALGLEE